MDQTAISSNWPRDIASEQRTRESKGMPQKTRPEIASVRENIKDWPYVSEYLQATLDPERIADHGQAILRRALNNGELVAFVGSGVSMAYGRLGWSDLVRSLNELERSKSTNSMGVAIRQWLDDLNLGGPSREESLHSGRYPAAFQFLENLQKFRDKDAGTGEQESQLRIDTRRLLFDDVGKANLLLSAARKLDSTRFGWIETQELSHAALNRQMVDRRESTHVGRPWDPQWRRAFVLRQKDISPRAGASPSLARFLARIETLAGAAQKANPRVMFPPPAMRFVSVAVALIDDKYANCMESRLRTESDGRTSSADEVLRSDALPPDQDPLLLLAGNLSIDRFITTNYDLDIERLMRDRGFILHDRRPPTGVEPSISFSSDALGQQASDALFKAERAAELVDFALHSSDEKLSLVHLHGRATLADPMVVTDKDYLRAYMQRGDDAELAEHALALAFGANPFLFVGSGMSEDDILRPLRQFVTERRSSGDRQAVVLLPADSTRARQIEDVITNYSRFGVYTLHFGHGQDKGQPVRWLAMFQRIANCAKEILATPNAHAPAGAERLRQVIRSHKLLSCFARGYDGSEPVEGTPLTLWQIDQGERKALELRMPDMVEGHLRGQNEHPACGLMLACLNLLVGQAIEVARSSGDVLPELLKAWHVPQDHHREVLNLLPAPIGAEANACTLIASELPSAITGVALCLKLRAIEQDLRVWRDQRARRHLYRPALGPILRWRVEPDKTGDSQPRVYLRHPLALRIPKAKPEESHRLMDDSGNRGLSGGPVTDRFFSDAPSQTFRTWIESMQGRTALCGPVETTGAPTVPRHRRIFVLYAERGAGKGHFFEALYTPRRLREFVRDSWPGYRCTVPYLAFSYFNLSFSLEVVSAFDRLSNMLVDLAPAVFGGEWGSKVQDASLQLGHNRVARFTELLSLYTQEKAPAPAGRILIALSPFNLMFDERGDPKNAELFRIVVALLGNAVAGAPIDLMLICSGDPLPSMFCRREEARSPMRLPALDGWASRLPRFELQHLKPQKVSAKRQRQLDDTLSRIRVRIAEDAQPNRTDAWFHVLREARTANTIAKYFPEVALALAQHRGALNRAQGAGLKPCSDPWLDSPETARLLSTAIRERSGDFASAAKLVKGIARALSSPQVELVLDGANDEPKRLRKERMGTLLDEAFATEVVEPASEMADPPFDVDCRIIFHAFEHSRYLITLACAAAAELAWAKPLADDAQPLNARVIVQWWRDLLARLEASQANDKPDVVVLHVFEHYQARHESRGPLCVPMPQDVASRGHRLFGPLGWDLQQRLLWHMAVVGHPVEGDVLARAPTVWALIEEIGAFSLDDDPLPETFALQTVRYMLDVLVQRCLVFRIEPTRKQGEPPDDNANWRFTLHRFLQRAIFRQLHAPYVEHPNVDQFGLSMWATQPDDLPRPSRQSAEQIATLLAQWTGFPKDPATIMAASTYDRALHNARDAPATDQIARTLPSRLLRASFGVVRTVYAVGVVARFHDFVGTAELRAPAEGFFEQHRLQVRWIIEQARMLQDRLSRPGEGSPSDRGTEELAPFFPEEVVWLYNECGLFCLVEGKLDSAAGLFDLALRRARDIEGNDARGALWCRIHLNLAVTDIERGRIREARKNLQAIRAVEDENPILRLLATGYLALVDHYSGNAGAAEVTFKCVIEDLEAYGQSRSVAIFARHLAELYRLRGAESSEQARQAIDRSIAAATKGGHEDLRQMARLSRVRLAIDGMLPNEVDAIQRRLEEIETYGIDMGMPRLVADTAYAKAAHLLRLGETRHAMHLARQCLLVAKTNSLRLRQMTALALMGRICERRGMSRASRHLLGRAFELAESCDYSNARANVRRLQG